MIIVLEKLMKEGIKMGRYSGYVTVVIAPKTFDFCWKGLQKESDEDPQNIFDRIHGYIEQTENGNILFNSRVMGMDNNNALSRLLDFLDYHDVAVNTYKLIVEDKRGINTYGSLIDDTIRYKSEIRAYGKGARRFTTTGELVEYKDNPNFISDIVYDSEKTPIHIRADKEKGFFEMKIEKNEGILLKFDWFSGITKLQRLIGEFNPFTIPDEEVVEMKVRQQELENCKTIEELEAYWKKYYSKEEK
jgi:hypothetical protein